MNANDIPLASECQNEIWNIAHDLTKSIQKRNNQNKYENDDKFCIR